MAKFTSLIAIMLSITLSTYSQVRLNRGNILDASPQIGTSGYNIPIRRYPYGMGNLYITGNVTGGKEFKGYVPYRASTSFRTNLGSSSLSSFESSSVGLQDIMMGNIYGQTLPYYHPSSTILPLSALRKSNIPGSSMPRTSTPKKPFTYYKQPEIKITRDYRKALPTNIKPTDILIPDILIQEIANITPEENKPVQPIPSAKPKEKIKPSKEEVNITIVPPKEEKTPPQQQPEEGKSYFEILNQQAQETLPPSYAPLKPEFAEIAKNLAIQAKFQKAKKQEKTKPQKKIVISSLAGTSKNYYANLMRKAQQMINNSRFRDAYQLYIEASNLKPNDPLPLFGQVHALIAEGRFKTASKLLRKALAKFPQFISFELKGNQLLGSRGLLEKRSSQVKILYLKNKNSKDLKLLLGYLKLLKNERIEGLELISQSK